MSTRLLKHLVRQARELLENGSHGFFQIISAGEGKIGWPKISKPRVYIVLDGAVRLRSVSEGSVQYRAGDCFVPALDAPAEAEEAGFFGA